MTQNIIDLAAQASKEWMKEYPTPEETANPVPKRYLEIFAKLVAAKERNVLLEFLRNLSDDHTPTQCADIICTLKEIAEFKPRGEA